MNPGKVLFVFGTRPEAIKMAPVIKLFQKHSDRFDVKVGVTAQHREMLDQVLTFFEIEPDFDLNVMKKGQGLVPLSSAILDGLQLVFDEQKPDAVFVQGDTTTCTIASIAAFYSDIRVYHIEAGLRTLNKYSPYPEEVNRQITARVADVHFAPTQSTKQNLLDEGIPPSDIWVTGNTVIDALLLGKEKLKEYQSTILDEMMRIIKPDKKLILVTGHRRESFGDGFQEICLALAELSKRKDIQIVYPVHLNPNVQQPVYDLLKDTENIHLINPLGYAEFLWLMNQAYLILTDSGGIQEEAPSLNKPVLVMRDTTERMEVIESGGAKLVGTSSWKIVKEVNSLLDNKKHYEAMCSSENPFGDGLASKRILEVVLEKLI
ncbi:MAG: UDP-N-acetylglucosamine 2-epimerase (non-hydrolyzing) [Cyanothece sp. SIO1E1]|nr:UDP-N-acetylglucosamine 2-epimerase (non-hydrolyzing) [Cyanothece sp. SIO1E1]